MNKQESDILNALLLEPFINQRVLAEVSGHSLGVVNRSLKELIKAGYLNEAICPTAKAVSEYKNKTPKRAIILAAGFGMRMVPINTEMPKGLLEVNGEPLIERIIKQLHEVGIQEIYVVVGFMKEKYEYLMDEYSVELVVNPDYAAKNNLHSLRLVKEHLENAYIIPCDIWCDRNPFHRHELYSWYMVSDLVENESNVRVNRKMELVTVPENAGGNAMIGISYLTKEDADTVSARTEELCKKPQYDGLFWEEALYNKDRMIVAARVVHSTDVVEINTYEQLREIDSDSNQLKTDAIRLICKALCAKPEEVTDITVLKKGMTNRSFLFTCKDKKYIMRIPGEGTDQLINRRQEAAVYHAIENAIILDGDQIIYNPDILAPEFERSGYNSVWTDEETDEWLQTVKDGIVISCSRTGGKGGWQLYSISRWTAEDGKRLKHHLEIEFEQKQNRQIYWDDVALFCYPEEYRLGIRPMNRDDIIEVDNFSELVALDSSYKKI